MFKYCVEILENNSIYIEKDIDRIKYGPKGKVIFKTFSLEIANTIKNENS